MKVQSNNINAIPRLLMATRALVDAQRELAKAKREFDAAYADVEINGPIVPHTAEERRG